MPKSGHPQPNPTQPLVGHHQKDSDVIGLGKIEKQGSRTARLSPQSMTWDLCKVYKNGKGVQYVQ